MSENNSTEPTPTETTIEQTETITITEVEPIEIITTTTTTTEVETTTTTITEPEPINMEPNGKQSVLIQQPLINGRSHSSVLTNVHTISYNTQVDWGRRQKEFTCVNCKEEVVSQIELKVGNLNWVMAAVCMLCLCFCFCWICVPCGITPLFMDTFKDINHICPNCGYVNGTKKQME